MAEASATSIWRTSILAKTIKEIHRESDKLVTNTKVENAQSLKLNEISLIITLVMLFLTLFDTYNTLHQQPIEKLDKEQVRQEEEIFRLEIRTDIAAMKTELEQIRKQDGDIADRLITVLNENSDANLELQQQIIGLIEEESLAAKKKQRDETTITPPPLEQSKEN